MKKQISIFFQITETDPKPFTDGPKLTDSITIDNPNGNSLESILTALKAASEAIMQVK